MVLERLEVEATFNDELSARLDNALSTMVEFGATTEQISKAQDKLFAASKDGNTILAQQANVLRTLVDETEDADLAMRNMSQAFDLAAATGEKAEDAGRKLGRLLKGDTSVLRDFDAQARRVADAIDKIADPAERAAAAQRELTRAMQRQQAASKGMLGGLRRLDVGLSKVGTSTATLGTSVVALGAAMATVSATSLKAYIDDHAALSHQSTKLEEDISKLEISLGRFLGTVGAVDHQMAVMSSRVQGLTSIINDLTDGFDDLDVAGDGAIKTALGLQKAYQDFVGEMNLASLIISTGSSPLLGLFDELANTQDRLAERSRGASRDIATQTRLYQEQARAIRALAIEEAERAKDKERADRLRKTQLQSGQLVVDPLTGAETLLAGPAPFAGPFSPAGRGAPRGGGRGRGGVRAQPRTLSAADILAFGPTSAELGMTGQQAIAGLGGDGIAPSLMMDMGMRAMGPLDLGSQLRANLETVDQTSIALGDLGQEGLSTNTIFTDLANGGIALAAQGISGFVESLVSGEASLASFGLALLSSIGDLLNQAGQAFILLGAGVDNIDKGIFSPGALIAIGVGMLALGGAMKGFAARGQGGDRGGSGQTAQALERFGRRLFDREVGQESREVTINIEGRSMRGFVLDVAADGARRGQLAPVTPRRP